MGVPTAFQKASTDIQRQMLGVVFRSVMMSRPFVAPLACPQNASRCCERHSKRPSKILL